MKNKLKNTNKIRRVVPLGDLQKRNTQEGITLVALIITVIVLLILAIVSIRLIMNGGIIDRAERGTQSYREEEIKEKIGTAYQEYKMSQYSNLITLEEALVHSGLSGATVSEDRLTVSYKGKDYPITENGSVGDAKKVKTVAEYPEIAVNTVATENSIYISDNKTAVIPKGYKISNLSTEQSIDNGLVITKDGNEWVWIPVSLEDLAAMYTEDSTGWTMSGTSGENTVITKYKTTGTIGRGNPGTTSYREPDILSSSNCDNNSTYWNALGFSSYKNMAESLKDDYKNMIESMKKYGGFYVGRYELGGTTSAPQEKAGNVMNNKNWYALYKACKLFGDESNIYSRMIWGCQWDLVCKFIKTYKEGDVIKTRDLTQSASFGNYNNSTGAAQTNSGKSNFNDTTGRNNVWITNNIYDLAGNCLEFTQEAYNITNRVVRGGYYGENSVNISTTRGNYLPDGHEWGYRRVFF